MNKQNDIIVKRDGNIIKWSNGSCHVADNICARNKDGMQAITEKRIVAQTQARVSLSG